MEFDFAKDKDRTFKQLLALLYVPYYSNSTAKARQERLSKTLCTAYIQQPERPKQAHVAFEEVRSRHASNYVTHFEEGKYKRLSVDILY